MASFPGRPQFKDLILRRSSEPCSKGVHESGHHHHLLVSLKEIVGEKKMGAVTWERKKGCGEEVRKEGRVVGER